jgi:hypothetical protein
VELQLFQPPTLAPAGVPSCLPSPRSLLVFTMATVLGVSSIALAVQGVQATAAAAAGHKLWEFHGICGIQ